MSKYNLMIKTMTFLFTMCLLFSCGSTKTPPPGDSYEVIFEGSYGGKEEKSYKVIRSQEELEKIFKQIEIVGSSKAESVDVNFDKHRVVALFMGTRNTGGFSIGVSDVEVQGDTTYVMVKETGPEPGEMVTMALTNPYSIVKIEKNKNVVFQEVQE